MKTVNKIYIRLITAILPFLFLPVIVDSFGFGKMWILGTLVMVGLLLWVVGGVYKKNGFKIYWTPVLLTLFLWVIWMIMSFSFMPLGVKMRTVVSTSGLTYVLVLMGMVFLWVQNNEDGENESQLSWLTVSGFIVVVLSLIVFLIPSVKMPILLPKENPLLVIDQNWSLLGSVLGEVVFLLVLSVMWLKKLFNKIQGKENYVWSAIVLSGLVLVLFLDVFRLVKTGWLFLDWGSSWIIAVESLKQYPKNVFGVGVGNFIEAFYWWRGVGYNLTPNWSMVYSISGNYFTQLWAEGGLVGLILMLILIWQSIRLQSKGVNQLIAVVAGILVLLLPFNWITMMMWMWLVVANGVTKRSSGEVSLKIGEFGFNAGPLLLLILVLSGLIWSGNWWRKMVLAQYYYRNSLVAAAKNDGSGTYNWQIKAIALNENFPEYRRSYSQTNLALALSLLQKKDITEDDKQKAVTLVQQAVREGKATVALDNLNPSYWINLAVIYKQLVGVIDGSADWSVQAYSQAEFLDGVNPGLRLDFGGLLYALGNYEQADRVFEQAVTLKNDLANSWYNWAYNTKQLNKLPEAINRLTQALALVPVASGDYEKASKELEAWKNELAQITQAKVTPKPETLTNPQALPTGVTKEVAVPTGGLEPPRVEPTPTVVAEPTPLITN